MTTFRPFRCDDLMKFNRINMDSLTETYTISFYMKYMTSYPDYLQVAESPTGEIIGYIIAKPEGDAQNEHGHITALSVAPEYRKLGIGSTLINSIEDVAEENAAWFMDLYVRASNRVAISMYKNLGYKVYRTINKYYEGRINEDAFDMRKILPLSIGKKFKIPLDLPILEDFD